LIFWKIFKDFDILYSDFNNYEKQTKLSLIQVACKLFGSKFVFWEIFKGFGTLYSPFNIYEKKKKYIINTILGSLFGG
jgi:hypothetical protein